MGLETPYDTRRRHALTTLLTLSPDFITSGPNVGTNLGTGVRGSGTVGGACEAALENFAFSGRSVSQVSYTTLTTDPESPTLPALTYASIILKFINNILSGPQEPFVPWGTTLNVNSGGTPNCTTPDSFAFVMTRLVAADNTTLPDVETCGTARLPVESMLINEGCFVTVTVLNATTKSDVDAATQELVIETGIVVVRVFRDGWTPICIVNR